jgi:anthranilate 1,2-dioxygenase small subunit
MNFLHLSPVELQFSVEQLLAQYVHCIDEDRLEAWPDFFATQCEYRIVARENAERGLSLATFSCDSHGMLVDRVVSLRHANIYEPHRYRHLVSSTVLSAVHVDGVHARSHYAVFRTRTNGVSEVYSVGTYDDDIVSEAGTLRFQRNLRHQSYRQLAGDTAVRGAQ